MQPRNMSMSGVVDLAAVKQAQEAKAKAEQARAEAARQGGTGAVPASSLVIDVTEAGFERDVLQRSTEVPVVIDFWAEWCEPCKQLGPLLERLAHEYNGRFLLAKVDVDANQMLMQQFGIQGIPAVFAVVAGQALLLFQGAAPRRRSGRPSTSSSRSARSGSASPASPSTPAPTRATPPPSPRSPPGRTTPCWRPPSRRWTPATWTAPSAPTRTSSPTTRPTPRPSSASARPNSCAGSAAWTRRRSARTPPSARPTSPRSPPPPTWTWWAATSTTPSAGWSTPCGSPRGRPEQGPPPPARPLRGGRRRGPAGDRGPYRPGPGAVLSA